jgi:hypothetical protein
MASLNLPIRFLQALDVYGCDAEPFQYSEGCFDRVVGERAHDGSAVLDLPDELLLGMDTQCFADGSGDDRLTSYRDFALHTCDDSARLRVLG